MEISDQDFVEGLFAKRVSNPLEWFKHSRSLLAAARSTNERADILIDYWEKSDLENVATMLYGFSLENLFKAIWTFKKFGSPHGENWIPIAEFPKELKTHNLLELARLIDKEVADEYELSLTILQDTTTWAGRYPCSIKGNEGTNIRYSQVNKDAEKIFKKYSRPFTSIS
ncbi:MAG TPA: hypothetical protein ENI26_08630 [Methylophaga aminisulfidivorans]|uniref:HEPN domain-containing protein n=1 Tax=Methylophaga aminisulfidivorans TaxID=230105 RepID=A0A7C1ZQL7_9GAMM|nr:hypothetical protein [Methylophaga aminisulfidivorans]